MSHVLERITSNPSKITTLRDIVLVSPDAGAMKKIFDIAKKSNIENVINAVKVRDIASGKIVCTEIPDISLHAGKEFLIVDDICDGGRTFIELAKAIKKQLPDAILKLCISHAIFSAGTDELLHLLKMDWVLLI